MSKMSRLNVMPAILLLATLSFAQTSITTATIQGTVLDPSGAVVPGAEVKVRNLETNFERNLTTDANGRFVALLLPPGAYTLTISRAGFATLVQENLTVTVGQTANLSLSLPVAGVEERVVVTGTPAVEVTTVSSTSTLNQTTVSNTPILGRKFEDLLTLTPGVSIVQGPDGDEITFNGQRGIFNNISVDGGDHQNGFFGEQLGGQRAAIDIPLEAVKEFQVIAAGGTAEYGRSAGGIVNVITKSGTNELHGSIFHYQRLEALSSNTSDGKPLKDFHREQSGFAIGGPIQRDKAFFFVTFEGISGNLERANLSEPLGSACSVASPVITNPADEAAINASAECQRVALLNFMRNTVNQEEGLPVRRPIHTYAPKGKLDFNLTDNHQAAFSYGFTTSRKVNETFDVATYGNSANGIEGTAKIHTMRFNLLSTLSPTLLNEAHFGYLREDRPREAVPSNLAADTAMGFATTFRFGAPFFIQPSIDELFWRTQVRDNVSIVRGRHTVKMGGEWMHSLNDQVFRGFFTGRYIFDSVSGFLRYATPQAAGGFGPSTVQCWNGAYVTSALGETCPANPDPDASDFTGGPLLLYLQGAGLSGPATDAAGASNVTNEDLALFIQDKWQIRPNFTLNFGLRWEAQTFPEPTAPPNTTAYGHLLGNPAFPSDGTLPSQWKMFQPRVGFAWDVTGQGKSVLRASWGIFNARQNMLTQVGSITTNGLQQQTIFANTELIRLGFATAPVWPGVVSPPPVAPGTFPDFSGVRVFDRDYRNPRIYTTNFAYEQEVAPDVALYADFTWSKGVYLTNFLDYNRADRDSPFAPQLGEVMVTSSRANSLYRGLTFGMRKRFSHGFQAEANYTLASDRDNDSNERDPFTDRSAAIAFPGQGPFELFRDYSYSDRDIRHKFNFVMYAELPGKIEFNPRIQARSAQPITPQDRFLPALPVSCVATQSCTSDLGRNSVRKDNEFFSFDWRVQRPFRIGERYAIVPIAEMFNTFNNKNNINPLISPGLFNFDGFLRQGVGDPRQLQLAVRFTF